MEIFLLLFAGARLDPAHPQAPQRDRIIVSHGHTAAGLYAALGHTGFIPIGEVVTSFRQHGSIYEGHPTRAVPGVEWAGGNLGQGLSVGCGMALATRFTGEDYHVYVVMGDGEQQKGQLTEAQRFAAHHRLTNLTAIIDLNGLQATGATGEVMAQHLTAEYTAHGWEALAVDGHDFDALYLALHQCRTATRPTVILARTTMGKGVAGKEDCHTFHGQPLSEAECAEALAALTVVDDNTQAISPPSSPQILVSAVETRVLPGTAHLYPVDAQVENRSAFGTALAELAESNIPRGIPLVALDCDLLPSVKTDRFAARFPAHLIQCGIQEHHAAALTGGLAAAGVLPFFADFGVFAIGETYNQQRLNDINHAGVKLICTHCGLDVGEDGESHQCIDYIGLFANFFGWRLIVPADANQTDRAVRYMATTPGNIALAIGRSKLPVLAGKDGEPFFGAEYRFEYGKADWLVHGSAATIITCGSMAHRAVKAAGTLAADGYAVGVLNISCPLALDHAAIRRAAATGTVLVYEDHHVRTGLGSLLAALILEEGLSCRFQRLGITRYGTSALPDELYRDQGLDVEAVVARMRHLLEEQSNERTVSAC